MATVIREKRIYGTGDYGIIMIHRLLNSLLFVLNLLLVIRLVFKAAGANENSGFVDFIYSITQPFVSPFIGIFSNPGANGGFFEWATLIAVIVYSLAVVILLQLVDMFARPRDTTVVHKEP